MFKWHLNSTGHMVGKDHGCPEATTGAKGCSDVCYADATANQYPSVKDKLTIINNVASIPVAFVRKFPALLDDAKLSWLTPKPRAPPSDFWSKMLTTSKTAMIILIVKSKDSIKCYL